MHFGASLRLLRQEAGWTLRDLGAVVGVSSAYLSRVEHGHDAPPTPDRLLAIAHALGVPNGLLADLTGRAAPTSDAPFAARMLQNEVERRHLTPVQVARVLDFIERTFPDAPTPHPGDLSPLLTSGRTLRGVRVGAVEDAVDLAVARLAPVGGARRLAEAMRARDNLASAAVGGGLVVPYAAEGELAAALVLLSAPLPWATPDEVPVRAILAISGLPPGVAGLTLLGHAARLGDLGLLDALDAAPSDPEAIRLLQHFERRG